MCLSLTFMVCLLAADDVPQPASIKALEALQRLHFEEAQRWTMFVDEALEVRAKLREKPIYIWSNPTRSHGQHGSVFVWMHRGRPIVVGSTFSHPERGRRMICHEFHSLAEGSLVTDHGDAQERWQPEAPVELQPLPQPSAPDKSSFRRLSQMRAIARDFTAHSIDYQKERWELRLLPQPLYRYEQPEGDVVDGALFAFVTSAGTDPEVILVLEARKIKDTLSWFYRALRFSDSNLYMQYSDKEVWTSIRDDKHTLHFNADHTYRLIRDRSIDELPELISVTE